MNRLAMQRVLVALYSDIGRDRASGKSPEPRKRRGMGLAAGGCPWWAVSLSGRAATGFDARHSRGKWCGGRDDFRFSSGDVAVDRGATRRRQGGLSVLLALLSSGAAGSTGSMASGRRSAQLPYLSVVVPILMSVSDVEPSEILMGRKSSQRPT